MFTCSAAIGFASNNGISPSATRDDVCKRTKGCDVRIDAPELLKTGTMRLDCRRKNKFVRRLSLQFIRKYRRGSTIDTNSSGNEYVIYPVLWCQTPPQGRSNFEMNTNSTGSHFLSLQAARNFLDLWKYSGTRYEFRKCFPQVSFPAVSSARSFLSPLLFASHNCLPLSILNNRCLAGRQILPPYVLCSPYR